MKRHLLNIAITASSLLALTACSDDVMMQENNNLDKTPIELSIGGVDAPATTRAVITTDPYNPLNYFDQTYATKIFMIMKSTYGTADYGGSHDAKYTVTRGDVAANSNKVVFDTKNQRYWDDAHARSSQLNIWAYAQIGQPTWNSCTFEKDKSGGGYEDDTWDTSISHSWRTAAVYPFIKNWSASRWGDDHQDASSVLCQDLIFSNNLVDNSASGTDLGGSDLSLKFNFSTRKFPQEGEAVMKFYRAMSKITIKIIEGEGFDKSSTADFQFANAKNVKLSGFNTKGLFSIQQGIFQEITQHNDIPTISLKTTNTSADPYYTLEALAVPNIDDFMQTYSTPLHDEYSRFVSGKKDYATDVMMEFTIDNNKYQVTSGQLYDALHVDGNPAYALVTNATEKTNNGTYIPLEAGKNYVFTFTVGKTKINNITAQVAEWENVEAENFNPTNARITLNLEERGSDLTNSDHFSLYRAADNIAESNPINDNHEVYNWKTGYNTTGETPTYVSTSPAHWTTTWFWDSNKHFYHFRALAEDDGTNKVAVSENVTTDASGDYYTLNHGETYTDILWGAPMLDKEQNEVSDATTLLWLYGPTKNGFDADDDNKVSNGLPSNTKHQIYKAIGPTKEAIKLILFHMMSDVTFKIKTTTGADKVDLGNGDTKKTTIELQKVHKEGKLFLGNGLVKGSDTPSDFKFTASTSEPDAYGFLKWEHYGAIPQDLTNVVLVITTPDHNQYKVAMKDVLAAATSAISSNNIANPYKTVTTGTNAGKYIIDRWYPGYKYTYSFTLAKTGITNLQATIVDWEEVTADDETVKIQ